MKVYSEYLQSLLRFDVNNPHSEAYCRKSLELLETLFTTRLEKSMVIELLPRLISELKKICCYRNKNEYVTVLIKK